VTVRYRGAASLEEGADGITLQFMKHFKVVEPAVDPKSYIEKVQAMPMLLTMRRGGR